MSIRATTVVWAESRQKGSALLVLLALADYAHDDGRYAFPSVATLAHKARMSERQTKRLLAQLRASGELAPMGEHESGAVVYQILLPGMGGDKMTPPRRRRVSPASLGSVTGDTPGVNGVSPDPSVNQHEPSGEGIKARLAAIRRRFRGDDVAWARLVDDAIKQAGALDWTGAQFLAHVEARVSTRK